MTALCGAIGTCVGAWIKVFSVHPDLFYVGFIGQSIVATSQVILLIYVPIFPYIRFRLHSIFQYLTLQIHTLTHSAHVKCQFHDE